ncbi:hypothetical protein MMC16_004494 [Acarospora aff. strigata]|nr:hypothetical protein [Acarospora aff. strigata]
MTTAKLQPTLFYSKGPIAPATAEEYLAYFEKEQERPCGYAQQWQKKLVQVEEENGTAHSAWYSEITARPPEVSSAKSDLQGN